MKQNYLIAITAKLMNCLLFSVMTLLIMHSVSYLPIEQVLFSRSCLGMLICLIYLFAIKQPVSFRLSRKDLFFYFTRALVSFIAMQLWVFAIKHVGINEATALSYTGPFWTFLAARYVIGEAFNWQSFIAIAINMLGVLIILHPNSENISFIGFGASIGSILLWVLYEIICKKQTSDQHYMLQTFYVFVMASIITAPFAITKWQPINFEILNILLLLAALSVANVTAIFIAYMFAPMMVISPFSYARLVFTAIITNWAYHSSPHIEVFIGAAIILIANSGFTYYSFSKNRSKIYYGNN